MNIIDSLQWRYATKKFDSSKVLEKEAEKIPRLWKAEAAYEQVVTFLKLAEDEVKRLKKGAKIKKNKSFF